MEVSVISHWYKQNGEPCHEVPNEAARKRGEAGAMRETTLRDARKLKLAPSVTTVTKAIDKGMMLAEWQITQALYSALVHPEGFPCCARQADGSIHEKDPEFVRWANECKADARRQVQVKADRGSILHDACMRAHHAYHTIEPQYLAHVDGMMAMLEREFGKRRWITEGTFVHPDGFGGSIDIRTPPDDPDPIVADYKFKDFDESREASYFVYDEHKMQLGGYSIGVRMENARLFNLFGSISDPGLVLIHRHSQADADHGRKMFRAALAFWQAQNQYQPDWK